MKKLRIGLTAIAVILAGSLSAFSILPVNKDSNTTYVYTSSDQTIQAREDPANYLKGTQLCSGSGDECRVILNQDFGTHPDFSNVTFDNNGFPNGGTAFVSNEQQTPIP